MATSRSPLISLKCLKLSFPGCCMLIFSFLNTLVFAPSAGAQTFENLLAKHAPLIQRSSSKTVAPVLGEIVEFGGPVVKKFLSRWRSKGLYFLMESNQFAYTQDLGDDRIKLINVETGAAFATVTKASIKQIKPNSGVRAKISASLIPFLLASADPKERATSLDALARDFNESHLALLNAAITTETNAALKRRLERAYRFGLIG
ncbi:MAG: hypothetical protein L7W41_06795, partial [Alphaproteobacteria bacterium]|nr:hypothetical protein [Alphaproteobacteria bacterium]